MRITPSGEVTNTASVMLLSTLVQIVLVDGGLAQLLPRMRSSAACSSPSSSRRPHFERPGVVALGDALGALMSAVIGCSSLRPAHQRERRADQRHRAAERAGQQQRLAQICPAAASQARQQAAAASGAPPARRSRRALRRPSAAFDARHRSAPMARTGCDGCCCSASPGCAQPADATVQHVAGGVADQRARQRVVVA